VEANSDAAVPRSMAFLDTSTLFILFGCSGSIEDIREAIGERQLVLHQVHYDEAVRRLREAVIQLIHSGRNGGECLTALAQRVLQRLGLRSAKITSLRDMGRLKRKAQQESQRLLSKLLSSIDIRILDYGGELLHGSIRCQGLSYEDILLVELVRECYIIVSSDNELIKCCRRNTDNTAKCLKIP